MIIKKWRRASQGAFLYKLGQLLDQGYSLNKSTELLRPQLRKKEKYFLDHALDSLDDGQLLIEFFSKLDLPKEVLSSIGINSANGNIAESLMENGIFMKKKAEWLERLNKTIRYPLFLIFLTVWIGFLFYHFLFPQFLLLFSSLEIKTPVFTSIMIYLLTFIPKIVFLFLAFLIFCGIAVTVFKNRIKPSSRMVILTSIPIIKSYLKLLNTHYLCVNFGSMLNSGLSVTDALIVMEKQMQIEFLKEESIRIQKGLINGKSLPDLLKDKPFYVQELAGIIHFGQVHGKLGSDLLQYGEWLFKALEDKLLNAMQKIQPLLFGLIGGFVLLLFASMLLPMFNLMEAL